MYGSRPERVGSLLGLSSNGRTPALQAGYPGSSPGDSTDWRKHMANEEMAEKFLDGLGEMAEGGE